MATDPFLSTIQSLGSNLQGQNNQGYNYLKGLIPQLTSAYNSGVGQQDLQGLINSQSAFANTGGNSNFGQQAQIQGQNFNSGLQALIDARAAAMPQDSTAPQIPGPGRTANPVMAPPNTSTTQTPAAVDPGPGGSGSVTTTPYDQSNPIFQNINKYLATTGVMDNPTMAKPINDYLNTLQQAIDAGLPQAQIQQAAETIQSVVRNTPGSALAGDVTGATQSLANQLILPTLAKQQQQATDTKIADQQAQQDALLQKLQANVPVLGQQLSDQLGQQAQTNFKLMQPMIEDRLQALGLLQSGALPEAQARAMQGLQSAAQNQVGNFETQELANLNFAQPLLNQSNNLQESLQALLSAQGLNQSNVSRLFQTQDVAQQDQLQMTLAQQAMDQARQQASQNQLTSLLGAGIGAAGAIVGGRLARPMGGLGGTQQVLPASAGMLIS